MRVLARRQCLAEDGKAVPVTSDPVFKSRHVIVTPGKPGYNVSRTIRDEEAREVLLALIHDVAVEGSSAAAPSDATWLFAGPGFPESAEEVPTGITFSFSLTL